MAKKQIRLSKRLETIAEFIEKGSDVVDIGTNHGYLPVYLAQTGLARRIIASDISAPSLKAARVSAMKYGVTDKIDFLVTPGLAGISETEVDTVVISGVGGETIISILSDAPWTKLRRTKLILQPQTKIEKLCAWLHENGYSIQKMKQTQDKGRSYFVVVARSNMGVSEL